MSRRGGRKNRQPQKRKQLLIEKKPLESESTRILDMLPKVKNWNEDRWIAFSAVLIAFASMGLTVWQGVVTRTHNRASVRPLIVLGGMVNADGVGWTTENFGMGPALIKWFKLSVDGEIIDNWGDFYKKLNLSGTYKWWNPATKSVLKTGDSRYLFWSISKSDSAKIKTNTRNIIMNLCYCSIYNECWLASSGIEALPNEPCIDPPKIQFKPHIPIISHNHTMISSFYS